MIIVKKIISVYDEINRSIVKRKRKYDRGEWHEENIKNICLLMISASTVSASKLEILSESEDYEKIVELADEIVSVTNGGPVEDPFEEGIRVSDIDFDNALKEYIDTPLLTSELLSVSEVESALEQSDYIWIIPIRAYGHLYEACAVRANGEDGQPIDQWHISGARGYELDDTPTYIEQLNISLAANPDIVWDNYKFRLVGGVDPRKIDLMVKKNSMHIVMLRLLPQLLIRLISKLTMHKEEPILSLMLQISR